MKSNTAAAIMWVFWAVAISTLGAGVVFLAYHDKDGWGWLVFVMVCLCTIRISTTNNDTDVS